MMAVFGAAVLSSMLSRVMLLAIEVAVEYWLALTWSPQAQWLLQHTEATTLKVNASCHLCLERGEEILLFEALWNRSISLQKALHLDVPRLFAERVRRIC